MWDPRDRSRKGRPYRVRVADGGQGDLILVNGDVGERRTQRRTLRRRRRVTSGTDGTAPGVRVTVTGRPSGSPSVCLGGFPTHSTCPALRVQGHLVWFLTPAPDWDHPDASGVSVELGTDPGSGPHSSKSQSFCPHLRGRTGTSVTTGVSRGCLGGRWDRPVRL